MFTAVPKAPAVCILLELLKPFPKNCEELLPKNKNAEEERKKGRSSFLRNKYHNKILNNYRRNVKNRNILKGNS